MAIRPWPADNGSDETLHDWPERFVDSLNTFYTPLLVFFGTFGNILSIIAFLGSTLRHISTSRYLSALAISDTLFLIQIFAVWLHTMKLWDLFVWDVFCQVFMYASYVSCNLSAWLVVAFTVERYVAVSHPLRRASICTLGRAHSVIFSLVFISLAINAPVVLFAQPNDECTVNEAYYAHAERFNVFDALVSFTIPLGAICVFNRVISQELRKTEIIRAELLRESYGGKEPPRRSQYTVTSMLLVVSSVFVILNLPAYVLRMVAYTKNEHSQIWVLAQRICTMIFNTNFGINFILYCLTGQNLRRALVIILIPKSLERRWYGDNRRISHPNIYIPERGERLRTHIYYSASRPSCVSETQIHTDAMCFKSSNIIFDSAARKESGPYQDGTTHIIRERLLVDHHVGQHVALIHSPPSEKKQDKSTETKVPNVHLHRPFKTDLGNMDEIKPYIEESPNKLITSNLRKEILTQSWLDIYSQLGLDKDEILEEHIAAEISAAEAYSKAMCQKAKTSSQNRPRNNETDDYSTPSTSSNMRSVSSGECSFHRMFKPLSVIDELGIRESKHKSSFRKSFEKSERSPAKQFYDNHILGNISKLSTMEHSGLTCITKCFRDSLTRLEETRSFESKKSSQRNVEKNKPVRAKKNEPITHSPRNKEKIKPQPKCETYLSPCGWTRQHSTYKRRVNS